MAEREASRIKHGNHEHQPNGDRPVISRRWQAATVVGNSFIGVAELVTGNVSTLAVTADGIHNAGDVAAYAIQTQNVLNPDLTEERRNKRRKIAHTIIFLSSLAVSAKAGTELAFDHETKPNPITIYAAGSSLALNSLLLATLYRGMRRKKREDTVCIREHDLTKHLLAVDIPSAGLAVTGAVAQQFGYSIVDPIAAIASSAVGAWAFRPTEANLDHSHCAKHGNHDQEAHGHVDPDE